MTFSRNAAVRRILSPILLAAVASAAWQAPAAAQRAPKGEKKAAAQPKANYSKGFVAAYKPLEAQVNAPAPDYAAIKAALPGLIAASQTPDDRAATGRLVFTVGQKSNDHATALQGAEMVIASGKVDAAASGQFNMVAAQLAFNLKDYAKARTYAETAIKAGYTQNDPELLVAESYFAQDQYAPGLKYLADTIAARKAAGQPVPEAWVKRGLATAYNNQLDAEANQWAVVYARDFPSESSWGDAISIAINNGNYAAPEMLDLLRLARRTKTMRSRGQYLEYIDSADPRKLPNEVMEAIEAGTAAKLVDPSLQAVKEARASAQARLAADKTELPALQRDAGAAGAKLVTVMAAADTLLSYGKAAEAETLYTRALTMPGVNTALVLTRLGIAQLDQGKHAEAQANFAKVQGPRRTIANLWALYAAQKASPSAGARRPPAERQPCEEFGASERSGALARRSRVLGSNAAV